MKNAPFTLLVGILITLLGSSLYTWALFDIQKKNEHIRTYESEVEAQKGESAHLHSLSALLEATKSDRDKLETYILNVDGVATLLEDVESLGAVTKATIEIVSVAVNTIPLDTKGEFEEVSLAITMQGTFSRVYHALSLLEALPYPLKTTYVRLEARKDGKKNSWTASVTLSVLKHT